MTQPTIRSGSMRTMLRLTFLGALVGLLPIAAQAREWKGDAIKVASLEIETVTFREPIRRLSADGEPKTYTRAHRIILEGQFGPYRAEPVELYFGDYRVEEYSGTSERVEITIFEPELLERFEGQALRYRPPRGELRTLGVAFSRDGLRPIEETFEDRE